MLWLFALTLLCIYIRPLNLPLWVYSSLGAALCVGFGFVSLSDVAFVWGMVWDSTFSLVGLIIFALSLEKLGFFEVLAHYTLRLSTHRQTLHSNLEIFCLYRCACKCVGDIFF